MLKEFKEFAMKGNVMDMAVGVILGASFGSIVKSLVDDVIMPPIGLMLGKIDFSNLFVILKAANNGERNFPTIDAAKQAGAVTLNYGMFTNHVVSFLIVAFSVFLIVKSLNKLKKEPAAAAPNTKECPYCYSAIPLQAKKCGHCTSELK